MVNGGISVNEFNKVGQIALVRAHATSTLLNFSRLRGGSAPFMILIFIFLRGGGRTYMYECQSSCTVSHWLYT